MASSIQNAYDQDSANLIQGGGDHQLDEVDLVLADGIEAGEQLSPASRAITITTGHQTNAHIGPQQKTFPGTGHANIQDLKLQIPSQRERMKHSRP